MENDNVLQHLPAIRAVRADLNLHADDYPDAVVLAFIAIESSGDVDAVSRSGNHYGILQCMNAYVLDACEYGKRPSFPARRLLGDPGASLWCFYQYMERYKPRHGNDPRRMAVAHKGGAGTAKTHTARLRAGDTFDEATAYAMEKHKVGDLAGYVRMFDRALAVYSKPDKAPQC